jgi:hypothetical protein
MMRTLAAVLAAFALGAPIAVSAAQPSEADLQDARALAKEFMTSLKGELEAAIAEGGPVNAIAVCRGAAPGIAGEISSTSGWAVGRTAMKVRNPRNAPSVRERAVLMKFMARAEKGEDLTKMESAAVIEEGDRRYLHYMKAIPTGGVCLTCHGSDLGPELEEAIQESYPADAATGFEAGELRGAFTFVKPLD